MKSKKRYASSSEESEESDASQKSSSSDSESEDSSASEHKYKKKRKRVESSETESESDDQKRVKKRKHKKKKKKHAKKHGKKHDSGDESDSGEEKTSISEGEISSKKKRKHKHKHRHHSSKRAHSSSASVIEEDRGERRLHSVVKERRDTSLEESPPPRTYYQKEYHQVHSGQDYEREREVQRFYRGSSKEPRIQYQENNHYNREHNDRYTAYREEKYDRNRSKYGQNIPHNNSNEEYIKRPREYNDYKRHERYEDHKVMEQEYQHKRPNDNYHAREDPRGRFKPNQFDKRGPKRPYDDGRNGRDFRERRGPPEERYRQNEYPEVKERFPAEVPPLEKPRESRVERDLRGGRDLRAEREVREVREVREPKRDDRPRRLETKPSITRDRSRSRSPQEYRDRQRPRPEPHDRRSGGGDGGGSRSRGMDEDNERGRGQAEGRGRIPREEKRDKPEPRKERKSRFDNAEEGKEYSWGKAEVKKEGGKEADKEKPNFGLSGKLTADVNMVNGVVIKYTEPDDAKQPKRRWRFYPFKGDKELPILYIHRQSAFLIGRDKKVADITLEHPSISKQHAALQYRATPFTRADGSQGRRVRPYVIDLESANGTFVNNKKIEPRRYIELLERDVVKFGFSQREYVLLHENSKDDALDDDHDPPPDVGSNVTTTHQIKQEKRVKQEMAEDGE